MYAQEQEKVIRTLCGVLPTLHTLPPSLLYRFPRGGERVYAEITHLMAWRASASMGLAAWPSMAYLAGKAGVSVRTVRRIVAWLVAEKLFEVVRRAPAERPRIGDVVEGGARLNFRSNLYRPGEVLRALCAQERHAIVRDGIFASPRKIRAENSVDNLAAGEIRKWAKTKGKMQIVRRPNLAAISKKQLHNICAPPPAATPNSPHQGGRAAALPAPQVVHKAAIKKMAAGSATVGESVAEKNKDKSAHVETGQQCHGLLGPALHVSDMADAVVSVGRSETMPHNAHRHRMTDPHHDANLAASMRELEAKPTHDARAQGMNAIVALTQQNGVDPQAEAPQREEVTWEDDPDSGKKYAHKILLALRNLEPGPDGKKRKAQSPEIAEIMAELERARQ